MSAAETTGVVTSADLTGTSTVLVRQPDDTESVEIQFIRSGEGWQWQCGSHGLNQPACDHLRTAFQVLASHIHRHCDGTCSAELCRVQTAYFAAIRHRGIEDRRADLIWSGLNPARFLTSAGDVDHARLNAFLDIASPPPTYT